jgi:hypothetical protein
LKLGKSALKQKQRSGKDRQTQISRKNGFGLAMEYRQKRGGRLENRFFGQALFNKNKQLVKLIIGLQPRQQLMKD